jgi:hypothetical protein
VIATTMTTTTTKAAIEAELAKTATTEIESDRGVKAVAELMSTTPWKSIIIIIT